MPTPVFVSAVLDTPQPMAVLHDQAYLIQVVEILGRTASLQSSQQMVFDLQDKQELQHRSEDALTLHAGLKRVMSTFPRHITEAVEAGTANPMQYLIIGTYHATVLKLVANLAYPIGRSKHVQEPFFGLSRGSISGAARLASTILRSGTIRDMPPLLPWCFWVAARISFIDSYMARSENSTEFNVLVQALEGMSHTWPVAGRHLSTPSALLSL